MRPILPALAAAALLASTGCVTTEVRVEPGAEETSGTGARTAPPAPADDRPAAPPGGAKPQEKTADPRTQQRPAGQAGGDKGGQKPPAQDGKRAEGQGRPPGGEKAPAGKPGGAKAGQGDPKAAAKAPAGDGTPGKGTEGKPPGQEQRTAAKPEGAPKDGQPGEKKTDVPPGAPKPPQAPVADPSAVASGAPARPPDDRPRLPPIDVPELDPAEPVEVIPDPEDLPPDPPARQCLVRGPVFEREKAFATIAWRYFENNYQPSTGFVNSVDGYPSTTMWDLGSSLAGTLAARELGFLDGREFDARVTSMLGTLATMRLFRDLAPNKAYSALDGKMTDYRNQPSEGIGWSALDLARLASWMNILACLHPRYARAAESVLARWNYCRIVGDGQMYGGLVEPGKEDFQRVQEGRYGYEQYGGKAFARLGFDLSVSARYDNRYWATTRIDGVPIAFDVRDPAKLGAHNYVVTESYALDALEFGIDAGNEPLLENVYEVQRRRWERTGLVTAVTEDNIDRAPFFLYSTIFSDGIPWAVITDKGVEHPQLRTVSTKAALSLVALFPTRPYSGVLQQAVQSAWDEQRGWYSGVYERGGYNKAITANTNGIVLELALYRMFGALHPACARCGAGLRSLGGDLPVQERRARCLPGDLRPSPAPSPPAGP